MGWGNRFLCKLRNFSRPSNAERELSREIASHLQLLEDDFRSRGMTAEKARLAARRSYGGIEQAKELHREERSWFWLEQFLQDIRFSARALRQSPGFSITAILTLALGIGANTAIFGLINSMMLKALPVSHPEQLLQVLSNRGGYYTADTGRFLSNPIWEQIRDRQNVFSNVFVYHPRRFNMAAGGEARYVHGPYVSGQMFETLGLHAMIGRTFAKADDVRGCRGTAVLSNSFWQRQYEGRVNVVGGTISLEKHPFEIIGVLPPGFTGVEVGKNADVYVPLCSEKIIDGEKTILDGRGASWLQVIGRPKPNLSVAQIEARLGTLAPDIFEATLPPNLPPEAQDRYRKRAFKLQLVANGVSNIRNEYQRALLLLMAIVGVVLLIACANVANLLLARSAARQKEIAIRMALGSGRGRLVRQLLTESLMLSLSGAAIAIVFAHWATRLLVTFLSSSQNQVFLDLSVDSRVLAFTAGVAVFTTLLFGLAPALRGTRVDPQLAMRANSRGVIDGGKFALGKLLVITQVSLSFLLLVGAGLMISTFFRLETLNAGFDRKEVLIASMDLPNGSYPLSQRQAIFEQVLESLRALPGVQEASSSDATPMSGAVWADILHFDDYVAKGREDTLIYKNAVSDRFFHTFGTEMIAERDFNAYDISGSPKVAIINQTMAKKFFAGHNPIGQRYRPQQGIKLGEPVEIVGIVKDAKYATLRELIMPTAYIPVNQASDARMSLNYELRVAGNPTAMISSVKSAITAVSRDALLQFTTLEVQVNESLARERLLATLSGFFGGLALLLASVGLYGVMSYNVSRRRNEIGIRMALGAKQARVLRGVLAEVATLIVIGLVIGLAAALATTRLLASFLYAIKPSDPWTLSLAAATLAIVALLAGYLPARRASSIEPMNALREE